MPYMLLIVEPPGQREARSEAEGRAVYERMTRYAQQLRERGLLRGAESLASRDGSPARVSVRGGQAAVVDGPFAEAKELIGGYFLLDCESREEAIALARECPAAEWATVEVRRLGPCFT
ncbi:YciI family protein [Ramlibacter rhizophilus]|uniref:Dehydrogenase n=1 Tax=Ramlibacter rhizophilus TaxID=1781167 RepID=A0A4Z0BG63_9BURK|nr:YciI family protein [Ramlibacter rhizophilus]TFY97277.1 dehydrogenase [Ramlibacter rhizophilus]